MVGDLPGYGTVWYDSGAIANILSLKRIRNKYKVQYQLDDCPMFVVTKPNGDVLRFKESSNGLYFMDTKEKEKQSGTVLVNTVADNQTNYTNEELLNAKQARDLQIKIGRLSMKDFINIVTKNQLVNCPVTKADIVAAEQIYGPDVGSLKGKTVRRPPPTVKQMLEPLPVELMQRFKMVTLCIDVMYVNNIAMLVSISRNIRFATVEALADKSGKNLMTAIKSIVRLYRLAGFQVRRVLMDGEFTKIRDALSDIGILYNETGRDEHVGEVERFIRTLKERIRAVYNTLPFTTMPPRLVIEMAKSCVYWLNAFPNLRGISDTMSPREIIVGQKVDYNQHCKYQFGQYVQTHEQHDNTMVPRTIGALALRPTGNAQGNYYFFSLSTGRVINRTHATVLPMPDDVIERVNTLG
jgi:hypothetical protein